MDTPWRKQTPGGGGGGGDTAGSEVAVSSCTPVAGAVDAGTETVTEQPLAEETPEAEPRELSEVVRETVNSKEWVDVARLGQTNFEALKARLEIIKKVGAAPMRVLSLTKLEQMEELPCFDSHAAKDDENDPTAKFAFTEDALEVLQSWGSNLYGDAHAVFIYVSHTWLRPVKDRWTNNPHPDDDYGTKLRAVMTFGKWYLKFVKNKKSHSLARATADPHVYFWIDWSCADQFDPEPYKTSLPLYLGVCHHMLSIDHARSHERAWVRAEYLMAFAFMAQGTYPFLIPLEFKGGHDELDIELRQKTLEDPRQGQTTNACDTANIAVLTDMACKSRVFGCANQCNAAFCSSKCSAVGYTLALGACLGLCIVASTRTPALGYSSVTTIYVWED